MRYLAYLNWYFWFESDEYEGNCIDMVSDQFDKQSVGFDENEIIEKLNALNKFINGKIILLDYLKRPVNMGYININNCQDHFPDDYCIIINSDKSIDDISKILSSYIEIYKIQFPLYDYENNIDGYFKYTLKIDLPTLQNYE